MRLCVLCEVEKIPIVYRQYFESIIKKAFTETEYESLFTNGKIPKPFCFAVLLPFSRKSAVEKLKIGNNIIEDQVFYFQKNQYIKWIISSYNQMLITTLYNRLLDMKTYLMCNSEMKFKAFNILNDKIDNKTKTLIFKTISPILIEDKEENPILLSEDEELFNKNANVIHNQILKTLKGQELHSSMKFTPINISSVVVKHYVREFAEKTKKPYMSLTCNRGIIKISGSPEDLEFFYEKGFGLRTAQGFGMVEVIDYE